MFQLLSLPVLLAASASVLWLVVVVAKRAQHRRNYRIWQGEAIPVRRRTAGRWAP